VRPFYLPRSQIDRGSTRCGTLTLNWGERTYIMGIVNLTPDSFSQDGFSDAEKALAHAQRLVDEGADIIDVGGESTRPNATPVDVATERQRVMPAVRLMVRELPAPVSIDTYKAEIAREALDAGVSMVNDVWGLTADAEMAKVVAHYGVPVVLMHNQRGTEYRNLVSDVIFWLKRSLLLALDAGIKWENIIVDPGIGFGKTRQQNLELLDRLDELTVLGRPILLGTSRKFGYGHKASWQEERRIEASAATAAIGIARGADIVRVHDVREMVSAIKVTDAVVRRKQRQERG